MAAAQGAACGRISSSALHATHKPAQSALYLSWDPRHARRLSTGCPRLDACLGGGIDTHGMTEIAGAAGSGKTQLALQCMLQVQLPPSRGGLGGGAVFLHADSPSYMAPMKRLEELADAFAIKHASLGATSERLMSHVYVMQLNSSDALWAVLQDTQWLRTKQARRRGAPTRDGSAIGMDGCRTPSH